MIYALVLQFPESHREVTFVAAIDANKVVIVGVLLQDDASRSLRYFIYWAGILIDCLANYNAYNSEARVVSKAVSRV
jgi:hypothetical protein